MYKQLIASIEVKILFIAFFLKRDENSLYIEIMTVNSMRQRVLSILRLLYILWVIKK